MIQDVQNYVDDILNNRIISGINTKNAVKRFVNDLKRDDIVFKEDRVERVIKFIHTLKHYTGKHNGQPFKLEPWQVFIVANLYGFYYLDGRRRFQTAYIEVARKNGKALSLDTLIPTANGYTTMGDIQVGDYVLGQDGKETKVTFVTPVQFNRDCYKVVFEDGEVITADADHNWYVKTKKHNKMKVLTTKDILNFKHNRLDNKGIEYRYRVPINKPIEFSIKDLLIDPYVLGLWLGDGTSAKPNFTVHKDDIQLYDYVKGVYGEYKIHTHTRNKNTLDISFAGDKGKNNSRFRNDLVNLNLLNNKHIPHNYLYSSINQRLSLLQGLMDTDGYVSKNGQCEFVQHNEKLLDQVCELLGSLGIKYVKSYKQSVDAYVIRFYTDKQLPCFRLKRKYDRLKDNLNKRMLYKSIINVSQIESVPVKCITVDNEDHLYLCGSHYTTTHNTALMAAISLYGLVADGEAAAEILFAANSKDQAKRGFDCVRAFSRGFDPEEKYLKRYRSDILFPATNSFIKVLAADADKLDGYNCSIGVVDEYHSAPNSNVRDVIRSSQGMRTNPLLITITTAGFDKTLPCYELRTVASEISAGVKEDDSFFSLIYSLDENDNWQDPNNWVKANPNIDVTITKEFIATQVKQAINSPNDEVGVKTKNLNIWCDASTVWIPDEYIIKSTKKFDRNMFKGEECYVGVDLSSNIDLTAVSYLWVKDDKFYFSQDFYLPQDSIKNRPDKQMYAEWHRRGFLKTTSGNVTDYDYITRDILKVNDISPINRIFYDKYNATSWAIQCTDQGLNLEPFSQTIGNFNNTTRTFERLMLGGQVIIDDNPIMRFCLRNVELRMDFNGNVKPLKNVEKKKIDGVIAALQALAAYIDASSNIRGTNIY